MKKLLLGSVILLVLTLSITMIQMSSCTKANSQTISKTDTVYINTCSTDSITGLWVGTYTGNGYSNPPQLFTFAIEPNGNLINITQANSDPNSQYLNIGTWQLSNDTLITTVKNIYGVGAISYVGDVQTDTAILNKTTGTLNGIYTNITIAGSGQFTLTKVN